MTGGVGLALLRSALFAMCGGETLVEGRMIHRCLINGVLQIHPAGQAQKDEETGHVGNGREDNATGNGRINVQAS
jgi:hypothetical protein